MPCATFGITLSPDLTNKAIEAAILAVSSPCGGTCTTPPPFPQGLGLESGWAPALTPPLSPVSDSESEQSLEEEKKKETTGSETADPDPALLLLADRVVYEGLGTGPELLTRGLMQYRVFFKDRFVAARQEQFGSPRRRRPKWRR